jgi:hypothetical protein
MPEIADDESYRRRLEEKLAPDRIRATLAFAGLYQMTHEFIKRSVLDGPKGFFGWMEYDDSWLSDDSEYRAAVLSRAPKSPFKASLYWLIGMSAITQAQADRLDAILAHRHELAHELAKFVIDVEFEPDLDLFLDALKILKDISRFFTQIEMEIGTFEEHKGVELDDIQPMTLVMLEMCIAAYAEGLGNDDAAE